MTVFKKLYTSILLLVIGGLIVKTRIIIGDVCMGMVEGLLFLLFSVIYIVTLLLILVIPAIKKRPFNFYPLVTTVLVIVAIFLSSNLDKFESKTTLFATTRTGRVGECSLTLRQNGTFKIEIQEIEWSCYYKGKYEIQKDTLTLLRDDIQALTDSIFTDTYLIDQNKKTLFPLDKIDFMQDSIRWLIISCVLPRNSTN